MSTPSDLHAADRRRSAAGPVDIFAQQRRRGERAGAGGPTHPSRSARSSPHEPPLRRPAARSRGRRWRAVRRTSTRDLPASGGHGAGDGEVHRAGHARRARSRQTYADQPAPDPATFGLQRPRTTAAATIRCSGRTSCTLHATTNPTSTRCAPRPRARRHRGGRGVRDERDGLPRGAGRRRAARHASRSCSPSGHAGFLGGEFGQQGDPEPFAATLHEVLSN